jgi:hypothetical protein
VRIEPTGFPEALFLLENSHTKIILTPDSECGWICNACNHVKKLLKTIEFYAEV